LNLAGLFLSKQSRLSRPLGEILSRLQIVAGIDRAPAVHSIGEIERQIAGALLKASRIELTGFDQTESGK